MESSNRLWRRLALAALAVFVALLSVSAATYAWYVYNTTARTTRVEMAAGSSVSLQISNTEAGPYRSSTVMEAVGSSRISTRALRRMALQISTICRLAMDSSRTQVLGEMWH